MNTHDEAILEWTSRNHPELLGRMRAAMSLGKGAFEILLGIAFEAGREFQARSAGPELNGAQVSIAAPAALSA